MGTRVSEKRSTGTRVDFKKSTALVTATSERLESSIDETETLSKIIGFKPICESMIEIWQEIWLEIWLKSGSKHG